MCVERPPVGLCLVSSSRAWAVGFGGDRRGEASVDPEGGQLCVDGPLFLLRDVVASCCGVPGAGSRAEPAGAGLLLCGAPVCAVGRAWAEHHTAGP